MKVNRPIAFLTAVLAWSTQGCSLFTSKQDTPSDGNAFHATVTTKANPMPLPVEVAHDIELINNGQPLLDDIGKWEQTVPLDSENGTLLEGQHAAGSQTEGADKRGPASADDKSMAEGAGAGSGAGAGKHGPHGGRDKKYVVKNGDTLMKISFETYGNVYRWREIYNANKERIANFNSLVDGTILVLHGVEYVLIHRNGKPYLIRRNDTLVKISKGLYGTPKEWATLWHNNPELIHNPNKIYAGFTLYYGPKPAPQAPVDVRTPAAAAKAKAAPATKLPAKASPKAASKTIVK